MLNNENLNDSLRDINTKKNRKTTHRGLTYEEGIYRPKDLR